MHRRRVLALLGTTHLPFAGCVGQGDGTNTPTQTATPTPTSASDVTETEPSLQSDAPADLDGYVRPEDEVDPIDGLVCNDEEFKRHPTGYGTVSWGETRDADGQPVFALRVNDLVFQRGEAVHLTLTNLTGEEVVRGGLTQHNVEVYTTEGWQDVRGFPDGTEFVYPDEGVPHEPGDDAEWVLPLSNDGLREQYGGDLVYCPELPAGRYRFVSWGHSGAVAVAFDVQK